jgi:outer membrane protein TolC
LHYAYAEGHHGKQIVHPFFVRRTDRTRHLTTESARAGYDASVADYRQTVLTSFQQVEDNLVVPREMSTESGQRHEATASAEESLPIFQNRYAGGVDTYLQVVIS